MLSKLELKVKINKLRKQLASFIYPEISSENLLDQYQQNSINKLKTFELKSDLLIKCHELKNSFESNETNFYNSFFETDPVIQKSIWNFLNSYNNKEAIENLVELLDNFKLYDSRFVSLDRDLLEFSDTSKKLFNDILNSKLEKSLYDLCRGLKFIIERTTKVSFNKVYLLQFSSVLFKNCRKDIADCFWSLLNSRNEETARVRLGKLKELRKGLIIPLDELFKECFDNSGLQIIKDIMSFEVE